MAKAILKFSNVSNPDYLIITWALFSTPNAEIGRQAYPTPHPQRSLTVDNLNPVMHRFTFWQSANGTTLTTRLLDMDIDCNINESEFTIYDYVVGRGGGSSTPGSVWADPVANAVTINDQRLIRTTFYVEHRGEGKLRNDEVTKNTVTGFFTLLGGSTFGEDDTWFAIAVKNITQSVLPVPSSDYIELVTVSSNVPLDASMYRKFVRVTSSATVTTFSIPSLSSISRTKILINTHEMTGRYFVISFSGAETTTFVGRAMRKITLGKGEEIELLFTGADCKILRYEGAYRRLGNINFGRGIESNVVTLDGTTYNIADFPRLYDDFINLLPGAQIKTMAEWGTSQVINNVTEYPSKGFFAVDLGAGTFKVPDFRDRSIRALKLNGTDATRYSDNAGGFQMDDVAPHTHLTKANYYIFGNQGRGNLSSNNDAVRQEENNRTNDGLEVNSGLQTIPRNIGLIPQIII